MLRTVFKLIASIAGPDLAQPLRLLFGNTSSAGLRRIGRLRRTASAMLRADERPPLPVRLQIETTDQCNLKCRMCTREVIDGMNTMTMPLEQFEKVVDDIDPYYVTMNGLGEPMLDQSIFEKLAFLHEREITTAMPTNGTYLRRAKLDRLAENLPEMLTFSIDGAKKETFEYIRALGDFRQIIENYRRLLEKRECGQSRHGTQINVLCALQKANMHDYREMYSLMKGMKGVDAFDLVPVFDYDPDGSAFSHLVPDARDVQALHKELDQAIAESRDVAEADFYERWKSVSSVWLEHERDFQSKIHGNSCLIPWFSTYIDAKGRVYPCCYLTNTSHVMGNINEDSFGNIWEGERYRRFRHSLVNGRRDLTGCRTCARNDDRRIRQLNRLKFVL